MLKIEPRKFYKTWGTRDFEIIIRKCLFEKVLFGMLALSKTRFLTDFDRQSIVTD